MDFVFKFTTVALVVICFNYEEVTGQRYNYTAHPNYRLFPQTPHCGMTNVLIHDVGNRILGGSDAKLGEFPWMVYLVMVYKTADPDKLLQNECAGSLINSRHVLTASHCVYPEINGYSRTSLAAYIYEWNKDTDPDSEGRVKAPPRLEVDIEEAIKYPAYINASYNLKYDLMLFRLVRDQFSFNDFVKPICLPFDFDMNPDSYAGHKTIEAGWGEYKFGDTSSPKLQKLPSRIANWESCNRELLNVLNKSLQVCTEATHYFRACPGDSGSPLMYPKSEGDSQGDTVFYVIGVHSWGQWGCTDHYHHIRFSGYVWVPGFIKWILDNVKE